MRKLPTLLITGTLVVALGACSSKSSSNNSTPSDSTVASDSTSPNVGQQLSVTVGTDDYTTTNGARGAFTVALGSSVTISLTNPSAADDFHLHGYDLEAKTAKGETGTITFTADQAGEFEVESHMSEQVMAKITVK